MTEADPQQSAPQPTKPARDRRLKLIMAAVVIAAAVGLYLAQLRPPKLRGDWGKDLDETLRQARAQRRVTLALFSAKPYSDATAWVIRNGLNHDIVTRAVAAHKPLCVSVTVDRAMKSDLARKYELEALPTVMVFSGEGKVLARDSGRLGPAQIQGMLADAAEGRTGEP